MRSPTYLSQRLYLTDNPVRGITMPERTLKRPHRFLTMDEVRRLRAASEEPVRTIVMLATMTGLRIGEILALRWGRTNLAAATLRVEETCYHGHFGTPKTQASRREVPLPSTVVEALLAHRSRSRNTSAAALVFCTREGMPLAPNNLRKRQLTSACERAGIARIDWHTLRHTHGTLLHEQGTPLKGKRPGVAVSTDYVELTKMSRVDASDISGCVHLGGKWTHRIGRWLRGG
ncbi:MAG TPA: site-specific integrase, partial [Candidatus Acidoferrum sp.]|nr:site-specific integrase [Candidatus Acidoferrum sp.]